MPRRPRIAAPARRAAPSGWLHLRVRLALFVEHLRRAFGASKDRSFVQLLDGEGSALRLGTWRRRRSGFHRHGDPGMRGVRKEGETKRALSHRTARRIDLGCPSCLQGPRQAPQPRPFTSGRSADCQAWMPPSSTLTLVNLAFCRRLAAPSALSPALQTNTTGSALAGASCFVLGDRTGSSARSCCRRHMAPCRSRRSGAGRPPARCRG